MHSGPNQIIFVMNAVHISRLEPVTMQKVKIHFTHWGRDKMAAILQATLKKTNIFYENVHIVIKISLKFVLRRVSR